jgi:hypothetical protein
MKKRAMLILGLLAIGIVGFSQAVKDRQVIPVAVNLNQVLRMTITNGGNIEFVFNSIDDYRLGLSGNSGVSGSANPASSDAFYVTDFTVASSTRWDLNYGAEEATFIGTDDPTNTLDLANVGFSLTSNGTHDFETGAAQGTDLNAELWSAPTVNGTEIAGLENYPALLIDDNTFGLGGSANAGDATDNSFQIVWRCGTGPVEAGAAPVPMVSTSLLDQDPSPAPDRYIANVIFELGIK